MVNNTENKNNKIQIWMPLMLAMMLVGGMGIGLNLKPSPPQTQIVLENDAPTLNLGQGRVEEIIRYLDAKYVDKVDSEEIVEDAIGGIIKELDPHSNYISADKVKEVNEQLEGNFDGIGVEFMLLDDTIVVVTPLSGGPSDKVGIRAGDRIVSIADSLVAGIGIQIKGVVDLMRGNKGSKVKLGIYRPGVEKSKENLHFNVTREEIPLNSMDIAMMIDDKTGYIKLNRFSANTYSEFMRGIEDMVENHQMKDLVIDLRQNPGGYLQEATKILSQFFKDKDKLLVYTEGRSVHRNDYESTGQNFFDIGKIAVLIDEGSASASEIVAGAIQDWDRGVIIGRRSFGKGLVQEQYSLKDGSALRLTVARYYTPSGRSIQRPYDDDEIYSQDIDSRFENGELIDSSKTTLSDTTQYLTASGRKVYAGGGIMPDVFVPLNEVLLNEFYINLRQLAPAYMYRYYQDNKSSFESFELESFLKDYEITNEQYDDFVNHVTIEKGVKNNSADKDLVKDEIKKQMKARLGKHLFDDKGFYGALMSEDKMVQKAMNAFKKENPLVSN